jgi:hypothetical protein
MSCVGFKPTIPASEQVKAVHALDRSATVTGLLVFLLTFKHYKNSQKIESAHHSLCLLKTTDAH